MHNVSDDKTILISVEIHTTFFYHQFTDLSDVHCKKSVLALIDGQLPLDIHSPLQDTCTLQLLRFDDADPLLANKYVLNYSIYSR